MTGNDDAAHREATFSALHDGSLLSIATEPSGKVVVLETATMEGAVFTLRFLEVVDMVASNFRPGNIILDVELLPSPAALSDDEVAELAQSAEPKWAAEYRARLDRRRSTQATRILRLTESYGCHLLVIFDGELQIESRTS